MSNYHLLSDATPLTKVNQLELGLRVLRKTVERKLGKKEDPSIVKGDSELDSKLSNFEMIEQSVKQLKNASRTLHISSRACANQDIVTGRFLIDYSGAEENPVRMATGRMGEVYKESGNEINSLKSFSDRVQEELNVFFNKGIGELREEIEIMEETRTDYRAALSWLKATSVDPDKLGQIEKFRRVQAEVKSSKERFDTMKWAIQAKIDLLRVSRASLLSNAMGPLYKHEYEVAKRLGELFNDAADGITETTSGDYDFKILKELRSDYEGPVEEQPVSPEEEQRQEQAIEDDMLLLDLDSDDQNPEEKTELSEKDLLISDFLSTMSSSVQPTSSLTDVDDLFSLDEPSQPKNSFQSDLFDIFEAQNAAPTQDQNPC